jgi:hypothetical protein
LFAGQVKVGGGVGGDGAGAAEPGKETPDGPEAGELGVDPQRLLGAGRAVAVEMELIILDGGAGRAGGKF